MAKTKKKNVEVNNSKVTISKPKSYTLTDKIQEELKASQSHVKLVVGLLIVLAAGMLLFNFFKGNNADLGPAQNTNNTVEINPTPDVQVGSLPGQYTVKEGDTLFLIAAKYYSDGYKFPAIAQANKLSDVNILEVGQVLTLPKVEQIELTKSTGTGGAVNQTAWGEAIQGDKYVVAEGDWLSTIAGRAYGNVMDYEKIAKANNLVNPDIIEPGTVLMIPR